MELPEFTVMLDSIVQAHQVEERTGKIATIGKPQWGLPTLLAEYDVQQGGGDSGCWLKTLDRAINIAQASYAMKYSKRFADFADGLIEVGHTQSKSAIEIGIPDGKVYAQRIEKSLGESESDEALKEVVLLLWVLTQSTAFVVKLTQSFDLRNSTFDHDFENDWKRIWLYSAREIRQSTWRSGRLSLDAFRYNDSRDPGYCGTVIRSCIYKVD